MRGATPSRRGLRSALPALALLLLAACGRAPDPGPAPPAGSGSAPQADPRADPRAAAPPATALALHPDNPRYFIFRGEPAVLLTSGEHYGAVLNRGFDYRLYLDTLQAHGFNLTRTFSGTYRELPGSFGIPGNTLAPLAEAFLCPWARSATAGAGDGGAKHDLEAWDPEYFARLDDFITRAGERGIVVELVLFSTIYDDDIWSINPMNPRNNVQGIGPESRDAVYSGKDARLMAAQEALVRKIVTELAGHDNLYYEVCNEPYERAGLTREWNDRIVQAIVETEASLRVRHLIAEGIAVRSAKIEAPNPHVSVFNFHAAEPEAVTLNQDLGRPIADDETGGKGNADAPYRFEAWEFLLAGGAVFSHLDFSYTCERPEGGAEVQDAPGGGGMAIRKQIQVLKDFISAFDFIRMRPDPEVVRKIGGAAAGAPRVRVLAERGKAYAIYVRGGSKVDLTLELPAGRYEVEWIEPETGGSQVSATLEHVGGDATLSSPELREDVALRIVRVGEG